MEAELGRVAGEPPREPRAVELAMTCTLKMEVITTRRPRARSYIRGDCSPPQISPLPLLSSSPAQHFRYLLSQHRPTNDDGVCSLLAFPPPLPLNTLPELLPHSLACLGEHDILAVVHSKVNERVVGKLQSLNSKRVSFHAILIRIHRRPCRRHRCLRARAHLLFKAPPRSRRPGELPHLRSEGPS